MKSKFNKTFGFLVCLICIAVVFRAVFFSKNEKETVTTEAVTEVITESTTEAEEDTDTEDTDSDSGTADSVEVDNRSDVTEDATDKGTDSNNNVGTGVTLDLNIVEGLDEVSIDNYTGEAYIEINGNKPYFTEDEKKSTEPFESYSELDDLGRCGVAYANVCPDIMPSEPRGDIGDIRPSGWHTAKYSDVIEDRYLYNRSHLIAYSLAGENANEKNLITGTRYLNQETMQIFELQVLNYVRATENHVLYRVTPLFEGDNLVASGVEMEAWSVEDDGEGVCFNVFCYNVQPYILIDYATGESEQVEDYIAGGGARSFEIADDTTEDDLTETDTSERNVIDAEDTRDVTEATEAPNVDEKKDTYIINTNSGKFHVPNCKSVSDMAEKNKWEYTGTIEELKEMGYKPCKNCLSGY